MEQWLDTLNTWLSANPGWLNAAIAATALLESLAIAGLVVPGVAMLFVIAAVAGHHDVSLWAIMAWAFAGAVVGDGVSFVIGRHFKGRITTLWPFSRYPGALHKGEKFFHQHGGKSVILGRFVGPVRPIIPLVAGAFNMPARRFLTFNIVSALGWAPLYIIPGFLVGASIAVEPDLPAHFYPVLVLSLLVLLGSVALGVRIHLDMLPEGPLYTSIQEFFQRHPATRAFWAGLARPRTTVHASAGHGEFPLASLVLVLAASAAFIGWTLTVIYTDQWNAFNSQTVAFFQALRFDLIDPLFLALTLSGDPLLLGVGFALISGAFLWSGHRAAALHMVIGGIAVTLLTTGLKHGLYLARPETVVLPPSSPAYPSGHSSGVTVFYGLIAAFIAQEFSHSRRWRIYGLAIIPILMVALSRLYLGVHWFTDAMGGILLGLAVCGAVRVSFSRYDDARLPLRGPFMLALALWPIIAAAYVYWRWDEALRIYAAVAS